MKTLIAGALIAGALVGAAPAGADPAGTDPCNAACHKSWDDWYRMTPEQKKDEMCRVIGNMPAYHDECHGW
jgi:hypothetical protein